MSRACVSALVWLLIAPTTATMQSAPLQPLSPEQVREAIALGRRGNVPIVQIGKFLGDFDVFVEAPAARIASAAARALQQYRPFDESHVTKEMAEPLYRVYAEPSRSASRASSITRIVLQTKGANGIDGVVQPVRESALIASGQAFFDRLPETDFDIVIVTTGGTQKYSVSGKDRARIEGRPFVEPNVPTRANVAPSPTVTRANRSVRLYVQGDGSLMADSVIALRMELSTLGVDATLVNRGDSFDYTIVFGQGERDAAAIVALDPEANVVAVAVRGAFTQKGAANADVRDLAKKFAALK